MLFPAHAGMNRGRPWRRPNVGSVPRSRGDEPPIGDGVEGLGEGSFVSGSGPWPS